MYCVPLGKRVGLANRLIWRWNLLLSSGLNAQLISFYSPQFSRVCWRCSITDYHCKKFYCAHISSDWPLLVFWDLIFLLQPYDRSDFTLPLRISILVLSMMLLDSKHSLLNNKNAIFTFGVRDLLTWSVPLSLMDHITYIIKSSNACDFLYFR